MGRKEFDTFLSTLTEGEHAQSAAVERERWIASLHALYAQIEGFLAEHLKNGNVEISTEMVHLNESGIGAYDAPQFVIRIHHQEVLCEPIGTNVIGAYGRVDMFGPLNQVSFVLVDRDTTGPSLRLRVDWGGASHRNENPDWVWKLATEPPAVEYITLNEDSFFDALLRVLNG